MEGESTSSKSSSSSSLAPFTARGRLGPFDKGNQLSCATNEATVFLDFFFKDNIESAVCTFGKYMVYGRGELAQDFFGGGNKYNQETFYVHKNAQNFAARPTPLAGWVRSKGLCIFIWNIKGE